MNTLKFTALIFAAAVVGQATAWSQLSVAGIGVGANNKSTIVWNDGNNNIGASTYAAGGALLAQGSWVQLGFQWNTLASSVAVDANNNPILGIAENTLASPPWAVGYVMFDANANKMAEFVTIPPIEESNGPFIQVSGFAVDSNGPVYNIAAEPQDGQIVETWEHFNESMDYLFSDSRFEEQVFGTGIDYAVASDGSGRELLSSGGSAPSAELREPNPRGGRPGGYGGAFEILNTGSMPAGSGWYGWYPVAVTTTGDGSTEVLWAATNGTKSYYGWWTIAPGPYGPTNTPPGTGHVTLISSTRTTNGWVAIGIAGSPFGGDGNIRILFQNNLGTGNAPTDFLIEEFNPHNDTEVSAYGVSAPPE